VLVDGAGVVGAVEVAGRAVQAVGVVCVEVALRLDAVREPPVQG
jgi:hypothetical protein